MILVRKWYSVILDWEISDEDIRVLVLQEVDKWLHYFAHLEQTFVGNFLVQDADHRQQLEFVFLDLYA